MWRRVGCQQLASKACAPSASATAVKTRPSPRSSAGCRTDRARLRAAPAPGHRGPARLCALWPPIVRAKRLASLEERRFECLTRRPPQIPQWHAISMTSADSVLVAPLVVGSNGGRVYVWRWAWSAFHRSVDIPECSRRTAQFCWRATAAGSRALGPERLRLPGLSDWPCSNNSSRPPKMQSPRPSQIKPPNQMQTHRAARPPSPFHAALLASTCVCCVRRQVKNVQHETVSYLVLDTPALAVARTRIDLRRPHRVSIIRPASYLVCACVRYMPLMLCVPRFDFARSQEQELFL